ncbi:unnamed protein product, partial [Symbiodinium necroappetens]
MKTLSRLKLLRKSFQGTEVRVHAPATEGSPQAISLLGGEVPEQVWLVLRSGLVAWLDNYETSILGNSELGRVTGGCPAICGDLSPAFSLVIREAPWDVTQPALSIRQLAETAILVSRISLELLMVRLQGSFDIEDILLTTWGKQHLQELEASQTVLFVKCRSAGSRSASPTLPPDRMGILARSCEHALAAEAHLRRCVVEMILRDRRRLRPEPPPSTLLGVVWYGDWWETVEPVDIDTWWFEDSISGYHDRSYLFDIAGIQNIKDIEDALEQLSDPLIRHSISRMVSHGERFRQKCSCCDQYDLLLICAGQLWSNPPGGLMRSLNRYRFGVASRTGALPRFHDALFRFSVENLRTGLETSEGSLQELRAEQLRARMENAELEHRVQQLEARVRTSEMQLGAMSWLFPTFAEVAEFARSIPALRPSDEAEPLPVLALRFTHHAVNAHFAFGEEHENRQESIFKLFLGLFMGHLKPEELEPLYAFKHQGPDGTMGLYSRNNRRLVALLMFQA